MSERGCTGWLEQIWIQQFCSNLYKLWRFDRVMHRIWRPCVFIEAFSWFTLHLWGRLFPEWEDEQSRASWQWCCPGKSDPVITVDTHICLLLNTPREKQRSKDTGKACWDVGQGCSTFQQHKRFSSLAPDTFSTPQPLKFPWSVCCRWEKLLFTAPHEWCRMGKSGRELVVCFDRQLRHNVEKRGEELHQFLCRLPATDSGFIDCFPFATD